MISRTRWARLTRSDADGVQLSLFGFCDQQRDFAFDVSAGFELFENFPSATAQEFFMEFGNFAGDDDVAVAT